ncbi:MAG: nitric oxide reductase activation protein NorD [Burkholderiales bacterium]|nr:nitric oxide reductase activation protein NorD [Burkholderiales bacterium]
MNMKTLQCGFPKVKDVLGDCLGYAQKVLSEDGVDAYIDGAQAICRMGRGEAPVLAFLEEMPLTASLLGEEIIHDVVDFVKKLARTPNSRSIAPFLQGMASIARSLESAELFQKYMWLVKRTMESTTPKVHGIDSMYESACLKEFLESAPQLFNQLSMRGVKNWVEYGVKNYSADPDSQREYFSLTSPDSRAVLQRERYGVLFSDSERKLSLYLRGLWEIEESFVPYSLAFDTLRNPVPYYDEQGIHLPDVYDDLPGVNGLDRYRALLAHVSAHIRWTTPMMADNYSPFQRISIEAFEDCRVEHLAMREYPGLARIWKRLHPKPLEGSCPEGWSQIRHRIAMLSRALLDPDHGYENAAIVKYERLFREKMAHGNSSTTEMADLGVAFISETRQQSDLGAKIWFEDTEIEYRDDNRLMWRFFEDGDEEVYETRPTSQPKDETEKMPPRLYPEWDHAANHYRPDWVSLYENLHPAGDAAKIDRLLEKNAQLAKRLKKIMDMLKPQNRVRIRYQEEGSELDLDVAIRSITDFRGGAQPDPRINMNHRHDGRNIAVSLLLDLSASLDDVAPGCTQSKLEISQEAVSLLAWAVDELGDPLAIGGFHSDTRHEVRYLHFKGYGESWGPEVKGRLAKMEAGFSTRMGAAIRHAGHYLSHQQAEKKLLLVLTDGEPSDVDVQDPKTLIEDAKVAVRELDGKGVYTYCISLDPSADEYVSDIFGRNFTVIDHIASLPDRLPKLFMALTK